MRKVMRDCAWIISSYMVIFSFLPSLSYLAPYFWPIVFAYISLKILCPLYLQIPFSLDLLRFASHTRIFRDSIRNIRIKPTSLFIIPLFIGSFFILKPSLTFWFSIWIISGMSKLIQKEKTQSASPYHWRFPTELGKSVSPEYLSLIHI